MRADSKFWIWSKTQRHLVLMRRVLDNRLGFLYNRVMDNHTIDAVRQLTDELPLNDFGLPVGIYRCDLLPFHDYVPSASKLDVQPHESSEGSSNQEVVVCPAIASDGDPSVPSVPDVYRIAGFPAKSLNQAFVPLQYDEGFPAFSDGSPFWGRLEYEPQDTFYAFDRYLKMPLGAPRDLEKDESDPGTPATGTRSLNALVSQIHPLLTDTELLLQIDKYHEDFHLYYWGMRAHAYDLFRVAQHQKQQELRQLETQDEHYIDARKIRGRLLQYMTSEEEFWDLMTPKVASDLLKSTTQLERISAGLPASGPMSEQNEKTHAPFEMTFRTIAQTSRPRVRATTNEDGEVLSKALEDPVATELLQELVIKSGG